MAHLIWSPSDKPNFKNENENSGDMDDSNFQD